jgi:hypothetical protein
MNPEILGSHGGEYEDDSFLGYGHGDADNMDL